MSARVIVIALDAAEATLIERWAAEGKLPTFARLAAEGSVFALANCMETLPGAIWPEIASGISCGKAPLYHHRRQLRSGEARVRPVGAEEIDAENYFWTQASRMGCRTAVIDAVHAVPAAGFNGVQLFEWGLHDRHFGIAGGPPDLLEELRARHGDHPIRSCEQHGRKRPGYERLLEGLLAGAVRKTGLLLDVLAREKWDLFVAAYGESHCAGRQLWHFLDPAHGWHEAAAPAHLRHGILSVYQAIDHGVGALIEAAGRGATALVIASHGMGPYTGGPQLLPEVLARLGMSSDGGSGSPWIRRLQTRVSHAPRQVQPALKYLAGTRAVKSAQAQSGALLDALESPSTRAAALRNNRCGAIRLNLKGREPLGQVTPGYEAQSLIAELRKELLALRDVATGEPIVVRAITGVEAFGSRHHPDVPDLMVVFRTDLGPLDACHSPRLGRIEVPTFDPNIPRSGEHGAESRLWAVGRGVGAGRGTADGNVLDIAPTVLRLLELPLPSHLDGKPLAVGERRRAGGDPAEEPRPARERGGRTKLT